MSALKSHKAGKSRLSGSASMTQLDQRKSGRSSSASKSVTKEKQGPIDWSARGLKSKYRGEKEREAAWDLFLSASKYAEKSLNEQDFIIPTVKVERHPFYVSYYKHLLDENTQSSSRSKARLLQKRFVFDVQEVWLTNLEHLREHDPAHMGKADEKGAPETAPENANRGNGLHNRRDVRAIDSLESQVQSVSQKRAFANAYHTARLPNIQVVLDYEPRPTPHLRDIKCLPPTVESLMRNIRLRPAPDKQEVPEVFSDTAFPALVYALHVDRLLPSADYAQSGVLSEVLWRFSLYRNDDSSTAQLYQCREEDVAAFAARLIMNKASAPAQDTSNTGALPSPPALLCSGLVYAGADTVCLPCCAEDSALVSTEEAFATVSVAVLGLCRRQHGDPEVPSFDFGEHPQLLEEALPQLHSVRIEICVSVRGASTDGRGLAEAAAAEPQTEQKVYLECSPAELRYLLREVPAVTAAPLGGPGALLWWAHPDRALDTWPLLPQHLALERSGRVEDGGAVYSAFLTKSREQKKERGQYSSLAGTVTAEQVDGALSTLEALSCAQELIEALRLVELPSAEAEAEGEAGSPAARAAATHALHFEGSPAAFFSRVEFINSSSDSGGGAEDAESTSAHPPVTPLLYFDNTVPVPGAGKQPPPKTPGSPAHHSGPNSRPVSASQGHAPKDRHRLRGMPQLNSIMAPISDQIQAHIRSGRWERAEDTGSNLSLLASGALPTVTQVPGTCEYGRRGIWFPDHNTAPREYTQAAARFYREQRPASSHSVLVNMTFALDTALLFDPLTAWEAFSSFPQPTPAEEVDGTIPALTVPPETLKAEALVSPLQERVSNTVMVFTSLPVEGVDFMPLDTPTLPKGFRRHVPTKNRYGYREQVEVTLLGVDPVLATVVFGITRTGAVPNNTGVNNRNLWHNTLAITEHINRPRAPKDYHYILVNTAHNGSNEPTRYTTRMKADKMVGLNSSAFSTYEENYAAIQELRDVFNRQIALDARIEKVENEVVIKQKLLKIQFQNQLQRGIEKKMRKATKSELGWRSRYKMSTLMELQGNWERRRDDRTGMFFFRNLLEHDQARARGQQEQFLQSCQWEVPASWDGDPLSTHVSGGKEMARSLYPAQLAQGAGGPPRGSASFGSLSAADMMSELHPGELDAFDLVPARWDPHPEPQHHAKHQLPPQVLAQGGTLPKHTETMGAFDQPPDVWMPVQQQPQFGRSTMGQQANASIGSVTNPSGRPPRGIGARSETSEINSVLGNKSFAESQAPTIDTANLEHIAEQLVSSDELMRVIARRLGIPESQVVPADDLSSVFSVSSAGEHSSHGGGGGGARDDRQNPLHAPRDPWMDTLDEPEFDSDDDLWSDDDHEVGDFDDEKEIGAPEDMPQTQLEAAMLRRRELRELRGNRQEVASVPSQIPALDLRHLSKPLKDGEVDIKGDVDAEAAREEIFGWRRLPRPVIRPGFLADALLTHTKPPEATSSNTLNKPVFLMPISPVDACKYYPEEFTTSIESIFIPDAKKDMERSIATVERNIRREEELTRNLPTDDLLLFGEAAEFTSADAYLARQAKEDLDQVRDPAEEAREKAILAAKSSNIAMMEDSLAMDADPNTTDEFGNTLLILAAQQGAKRMCKFLLRKGANINKQSIAGNTPLHYCYAYSNIALGEYLKAKGADDSIVNVDKLTCYEGLSMDAMKEFYGDDESAHMVMPLAEGEADSEDD